MSTLFYRADYDPPPLLTNKEIARECDLPSAEQGCWLEAAERVGLIFGVRQSAVLFGARAPWAVVREVLRAAMVIRKLDDEAQRTGHGYTAAVVEAAEAHGCLPPGWIRG